MKSLKEIQFKKAYDSDRDDLLKDFYIPAMSAGVSYKRLAGFFSSGILSAAARGIADFIENGGSMKLIVGIDIHEDDYIAMQNSLKDPERYILEHFEKNFKEIEQLLREDKVEALGWMLANHKMEIKLGLVPGGGLFHLKVGIIEDKDGNKVSFSGSDNETPSAWKHNVEEFKVFRGWIEDELDYFKSDEEKFDRFWSGRGIRAKVVDLPQAIKDKLIKSVPKNMKDLKIFIKTPQIVVSTPVKKSRETALYPHQLAAIAALDDHNGRGILSMATGSGKTITALEYARKCGDSKPLCVVVAVPYIHLVNQWINDDIRPMFPGVPIVEVHGQSKDWKTTLPLFLSGFKTGTFKQMIIVGLYGSLASEDFTEKMVSADIDREHILFIADEVHNAGAPESQKCLLEIYQKRVGLSATPDRYFDEEGTDVVRKYFGGVIFEYDIAKAIKDGFLTPYNYYPIPIRLTEDEYLEYKEISGRISRAAAISNSSERDVSATDSLKHLLILRSRILKGAANKIIQLKDLLVELKSNNISNTLIYCDGMEQLESSQIILNDLGIVGHKFTQSEPLELRETILKNFASGIYKVLVAIKCLDEGVNVPATKTAIIVASTSNPREFIQRRGRVLRKSAGKSMATVYDFVVVPPSGKGGAIDRAEKTILQNEFQRVRDFIETAANKSEIYENFLGIMREFGVYL